MLFVSLGEADAMVDRAFKPLLLGAASADVLVMSIGFTPGEKGLKGPFSLGECFVVGAWSDSGLTRTCEATVGARTARIPAQRHSPQSICTDRTTPVRSGPEWGASQKHRHRETRPVQAVQPVSEGLRMPSRRVVRQTGCADEIAASWVRWGSLMAERDWRGRRNPQVTANPGELVVLKVPKPTASMQVVCAGLGSLLLQRIWAGQESQWLAFTLGVSVSERKTHAEK